MLILGLCDKCFVMVQFVELVLQIMQLNLVLFICCFYWCIIVVYWCIIVCSEGLYCDQGFFGLSGLGWVCSCLGDDNVVVFIYLYILFIDVSYKVFVVIVFGYLEMQFIVVMCVDFVWVWFLEICVWLGGCYDLVFWYKLFVLLVFVLQVELVEMCIIFE